MVRILVIDDEPKIVSFVSRALVAHGYAVDGASDGARGLELASAERYGLIVLDLLMPGVDGIGVLRHLRREQPEQEVLVLSAISDVAAKVRCLDLGAADYLTKPFSLAELLARVRTRVRERPSEPGARLLHAGRFTLDLQRKTVDAGDGPIGLANREFLLLRHLMRNPGTVRTRDDLLADVWGYSFDPGTNVVDVYIRRLRSKLGRDAVETVRHVGYALAA